MVVMCCIKERTAPSGRGKMSSIKVYLLAQMGTRLKVHLSRTISEAAEIQT